MPKAKSNQTSKKKASKSSQKSNNSAGSANHHAIEIIGLLGVGALIYAAFAMLII